MEEAHADENIRVQMDLSDIKEKLGHISEKATLLRSGIKLVDAETKTHIAEACLAHSSWSNTVRCYYVLLNYVQSNGSMPTFIEFGLYLHTKVNEEEFEETTRNEAEQEKSNQLTEEIEILKEEINGLKRDQIIQTHKAAVIEGLKTEISTEK